MLFDKILYSASRCWITLGIFLVVAVVDLASKHLALTALKANTRINAYIFMCVNTSMYLCQSFCLLVPTYIGVCVLLWQQICNSKVKLCLLVCSCVMLLFSPDYSLSGCFVHQCCCLFAYICLFLLFCGQTLHLCHIVEIAFA